MDEQMMQHGAFGWYELMTTDPQAAKDFYTKLFGWGVKDMDMGDMTYTVLSVGDKDVGGLMAMPPEAGGMPPAWGCYVTVSDVDETARAAEALGGKVLVPPRDIPEVGRFCVLQDPQGAVISAITYVVETA